jgi:hypothetical protein
VGQDRLVPIFLATLAMRQPKQMITFRSAAETLEVFGMQQGGSQYRPKTPFSVLWTRLRNSRVRQTLGPKERCLTGRGGSGRFRSHRHHGSGDSISAEFGFPEDLGRSLVCTNRLADLRPFIPAAIEALDSIKPGQVARIA